MTGVLVTRRSKYTASAILVALAVLTFGGAPASAGHDSSNTFHLDESNQAQGTTRLVADASNALEVWNTKALGTGIWGEGGQTGVFGIAGRWGETPGYSVPIGVLGYTQDDGFGVVGQTRNGMAGVYANSGGTGAALEVNGGAVFKRSGKATITAGKTSVTKTGWALTPGSVILATVQSNLAGVWVTRAVQTTAIRLPST